MGKTSKDRLAANEALFRAYNERVQLGIEAVKAVAKEDNQEDLLPDLDEPLLFYCECSDLQCTKRIKVTPSQYATIHKERNHFIIVPGHQTKNIEKVIANEAGYSIVEKFVKAPNLT